MAKSIPEVKIGNEVYQIKDRTAREHLVEVSETQPESEDNKLWIKNQEAEYEVPTLDEFNDLKSAIDLPIVFNKLTDMEPGAFDVYGLNSEQTVTYKEYRSMYIDLHDAYSVTIGISFEAAHYIAGYCCAYDSTKTPIPISGTTCSVQLFGTGSAVTSGSGTFVLPANTVYIRFFVRTFDEEYTLSISGIIKSEKLITELQNVHDAVDAEIAVTNNNVSDLKSTKAPIIMESISTPADVQTFSDGADNLPVNTLTVGIDPVQDLHGYDSPWPAGGGKNLLNANESYTFSSQTNIISIELQAGTYVFSCNGKLNETSINGYVRILVGDTALAMLTISSGTDTRYNTQAFTLESASTVIVRGAGASSGYNVTISKLMIESGSTETAYAPYSNICPISGHTGANVSRTGKNLFGGYTAMNAYINGSGQMIAQDNNRSYIIPIAPSTGYAYKIIRTPLTPTLANDDVQIAEFYGDEKPVANETGIRLVDDYGSGNDTRTGTFTTSAKAKWLVIKIGNVTVTDIDATLATVQIEIGTTVSETYTPYVGNVYAYTFPTPPGTVYGGTLTIHQDGSGELVVDRATKTLTGANDENWLLHSSIASWFYIDNVLTDPYANNAEKDFALSNMYIQEVYSSASTMTTGKFAISIVGQQNAKRLAIKDARFTSASDFKQALASQNLVVAYKLATPVTYQLTNQQVIALLKGSNNIWVDTGKIKAVDYPADTKLYIAKVIAELGS